MFSRPPKLFIDGVEIHVLEITLEGIRNDDHEIDIGALTLSRNEREHVLDGALSETYTDEDANETEINVFLELDRDLFDECKFDLTKEDLHSGELEAVFYIESYPDLPVKKMTLLIDNGSGGTMEIDVKEE
jgi:hypothetical protein